MPWQGNAEISIDRFDVRAHLDYIAEVQIEENTYSEVSIMPCYVCSVPIRVIPILSWFHKKLEVPPS